MKAKKKKIDAIETFGMLKFYPMTTPNIGCIANGTLVSGCELTVTGGNTNQQADGVSSFLVEVVDNRSSTPRVITKRNMSPDDLAFLIEHHRRNGTRYRRRR